MNMKVFKVFIVVAILVIPVMLLGVSCKNEESASKELAFEPALQDSMTTGQPLYAEAADTNPRREPEMKSRLTSRRKMSMPSAYH
jgi:hypothetical protein